MAELSAPALPLPWPAAHTVQHAQRAAAATTTATTTAARAPGPPCFPRGCASLGGAAADPAVGAAEQQLCVQRLPAGATEERLAGRYCGGSWGAAVPAEAIGSVLVARDSRKPGAGPASLLIDRPRRARAGGRTARTMPARGKARQGEGDAHGVRVREVARRSQGQAAEQLHAAPEADSNLCTAVPFCADE